MELRVLGPLEARRDGNVVHLAGAKPRAVLTLLGLHPGDVVNADALVELLWGEDPPRTAAKALQTHVSSLRRALGEVVVVTRGGGWSLADVTSDTVRYTDAARAGRKAARSGDVEEAVARFEEAARLWRGTPELPDTPRGTAEITRWVESHASLVEDRADALLAMGRAGEVVGELEAAVADAPLRERRWAQLMLGLYRAGRQGEALRAYQRARTLLADELGVEPGAELRRLEAAMVAQDPSLEVAEASLWRHDRPEHGEPSNERRQSGDGGPAARTVTFLLTDIEGSTAAWEAEPAAMAAALARHDALVSELVTSYGGQLVKTRGEGDATFSVFERPSESAVVAAELQRFIGEEPWPLEHPLRIRIALHTGEAELRDGDYFGRAVNRAARLRSLARGGQILLSRATADLVADSLPAGTHLVDLGPQALRDLTRPEHVFELRPGEAQETSTPPGAARERPPLPPVLGGGGPFVGRDPELTRLTAGWEAASGGARATLIAGEPGVGKTRLAGELARRAHEQGALVLYGRCDEDLGAPYQPFAEALRALVPHMGADRLRSVRGVEELARLVPELTETVPGLAAPTQADPDTERYVLFDAVVRLLVTVSADTPVLLVLDDLHWAAKPTLLLLRHLLRFGEAAHVQIVGTYRSTDLGRAHPLSGTLADLQRDGTAERIALSGLPEEDVNAYVAAAGYDDEELGAALSTVTAGNPFFLIEVLRHVDETGGAWDASTLPQGVREAVDRRLSRLSEPANEALLVGAVIGSGFSLDLVEQVVEGDLVDVIDEACHAGIVIEEAGGRFRFNHALVRQSLLAEVGSLKRTRLHRRVAEALEATTTADDDTHLADLARHWFECALAGGAAKAVDYCRRAGEQAMARLAYEEAADLYDRALQAADVDASAIDPEERADLSIARCEALLAAGDVTTAASAVRQLQELTRGSPRLAAWAACFAGQLAVLTHPEQLDDIERAVAAAAEALASHDDAAGEAKAHTVRAACLARLGRIADCETVLDRALTAARRAGHHRRVNAVLAGAPVAALWGPNPVPRAGGRCLDVIRLLRITTGSPAVEATSIRCQAVLEAFRGRPPAARRMLDTARRTLADLGLRHALLEVDLFSGIVELVADDPAAAEPHLRRAYDGFRSMGVGIDTAQAAALLARSVLALGDDAEAEDLCAESERLGGHDLQASIAWRAVRAQLLARRGEHADARRLAEAAVAIAERTDALVHHGDACLALATVLDAAGDATGARAAAERAAALYERKGANALVERARAFVEGEQAQKPAAGDGAIARPGRTLTNATTRVSGAIADAFARRDWAAVEALGSRYQLDDRRPLVGSAGRVLDADVVRILQSYADVGASEIDVAVLATRGERLALLLWTLRGQDYEDPSLIVAATDDEQRLERVIHFDPDDLDAAYAELDARYAAGEAETLQGEWALATGFVSAINAQDWQRVESMLTQDVTMDDHRSVGLGSIAGDEYIASLKAEAELWPDKRFRLSVVHRLSRAGIVFRTHVSGTNTSGGEIESEGTGVAWFRAGQGSALEHFEVDDVERALQRFDELAASQAPPERTNDAFSCVSRFVEWAAAGNWDACAAALSEDATADDRRAILGHRDEGRDAVLANWQAIVASGVTDIDVVPIATRGERLVLSRWAFRGYARDGAVVENEILNVNESTVNGLLLGAWIFDPDDLDAAHAELDARYLAGEAAPHAATWQLIVENYAALNRHEFAPVTSDLVNVDHRPFPLDRGQLAADLRAMFQQVPDARFRVTAVHALDGHGAVVSHEYEGTSQEGVEASWSLLSLLLVRDALFAGIEAYPDDELDAALARFEALRPGGVVPENANTRDMDRTVDLYNRGAWDEMEATASDDNTSEDRRRHTLGRPLVAGRRAFEGMRSASDHAGLTRLVQTPLAVRGDKLSLVRWVFRGEDDEPGAPHWDYLVLSGVDDKGRQTFSVLFDLDDLDAAFTELENRYLAGEAAQHAATWQVIVDNYRALTRHEFGPTTPDFTYVDHRLASLAPDQITDDMRALFELIPDLRIRISAVHALDTHGAVMSHAAEGTSQDGVEAQWVRFQVFIVRDGMIARIEEYPEDDVDDALARFEELRPRPGLNPPENMCTAAVRRWAEAWTTGGPDVVIDSYAEGHVWEDRRRGLRAVTAGRAETMANIRAAYDVGARVVDFELLATRGDRLAMTRVTYRSDDPSGYGTELLMVNEVDADGRATRTVAFDPDDLDAAFAELDARYLAGEAAPHADVWQVVIDNYAAFNRHELAAGTPDFASADHRQASLAPGQTTAYMLATWEAVPDLRFRVTAVPGLDAHGAVVSVVYEGTSKDGFEARWFVTNVHSVRDGLLASVETYADDQLDAALARFEELRPIAEVLENAATRLQGAFADAFTRRAWDEAEALVAEDFSCEDRRRLRLFRPTHGASEFVAGNRAASEHTGLTRAGGTPLAVRGDRLALWRTTLNGEDDEPGAPRWEHIGVTGVDADGRCAFELMFDPDDIDAAYAELDTRFLAGEAKPHAAVWRVIAAAYEACNARDWDAYEALCTEDFAFVDRRPVGLGALGLNGFVASMRAMVELAPDSRLRVTAVQRMAEGAVAWTQDWTGTNPTGGEFETALGVFVGVVSADKCRRVEAFSIERVDDALRRFDELVAPAVAVSVTNNAARRLSRIVEWLLADDWDACAAAMSEEAVFDDRRRLIRLRSEGRDAIVANWQAIRSGGVSDADVVPVATRGERLVLARMAFRGGGRDNDLFEAEFINVSEFAADGLLVSMSVFSPEDLHAAFTELDARDADGVQPDHPVVPENAAFRAWAALDAAADETRDWSTFAQLLNEHVVWDDRRAGLTDRHIGRDAFVRNVRLIVSASVRFKMKPIATRGERLVLMQCGWRGVDEFENAFEGEHLMVAEADEEGRTAGWTVFDPDDLDAAYVELDARYSAGEAAPRDF